MAAKLAVLTVALGLIGLGGMDTASAQTSERGIARSGRLAPASG
jgi:hypothetical protein